MSEEPLLKVQDLGVAFPTPSGWVDAVSDVSLEVSAGETLAIVGESGSGKSVTAMTIMGLLTGSRITGGRVLFRQRDLAQLSEAQMRQVRRDDIAMIFQDPMTSLDPVYTIGNQVAEAVRLRGGVTSRQEIARRTIELLREVGLPDPERRARSHPHQLSGGQRQRVMIAMALAGAPKLLIADEPTTALDVTVEAQILRLIRQVQVKYGTALMLVTHDVGVVAEMADRVAVLYAGKVMERGDVEQVLTAPQNPYTQALLRAMPRPDSPRDELLDAIPGSVPSAHHMPHGCRFHTRCQRAIDTCAQTEPPLLDIGDGRGSRCWLLHPLHTSDAQGTAPARVDADKGSAS